MSLSCLCNMNKEEQWHEQQQACYSKKHQMTTTSKHQITTTSTQLFPIICKVPNEWNDVMEMEIQVV